jgi:hypothetical protein
MKIRVMTKKSRSSLIVWLILFLITPSIQAALTFSSEPQSSIQTKAWTTLYYLDADYDCNNIDPLNSIFFDEITSTVHVNVVVIQDREEEPAFCTILMKITHQLSLKNSVKSIWVIHKP